MASTGGIRAGRAFVEVFLKDRLSKGLGGLQAKLKAFSIGAGQVGNKLIGAGSVIATPLFLAGKAAASAAEEIDKFNAVFGDGAESAGAFADNLAKSIGRAPTDLKKAMANFQSFFKGADFGDLKAQEMSQELTGLALDFASYNNLDDNASFLKFIQGLSGSSEVFAAFGIDIKETAVKAEAFRIGLVKQNEALTNQDKILARVSLIRSKMSQQDGAIGNAFATRESTVNQFKRLNAEISVLSETIGKELLPVVTPIIADLSSMVEKVGEYVAENPEAVDAVKDLTVALLGLGFALKGISGLAAVASGIAKIAKVAGSAGFLTFVGILGAGIAGGVGLAQLTSEDDVIANLKAHFLPDFLRSDPTEGAERAEETIIDVRKEDEQRSKELKRLSDIVFGREPDKPITGVGVSDFKTPEKLGAIDPTPEPPKPDRAREAILSSAAVLGSGEVASRLARASRGFSGKEAERIAREKANLDQLKAINDKLSALNETTEDNLSTLVG